jgi:threonine/homoserine/homoserine lactone efflux protein
MLAFTLAVFLLLITPGPGVLSTAGVGAAFGFRAGLRYVAGLCIGTNLVAVIVISGVAAIVHAEEIPGIRDALILQIINPKAYAVNMTWFSGFALVPESLMAETLLKFFVINLFWIPIHLLWLAAGNTVNQLDLSPKTHFFINIGMALALVIVVGLAIFSLI